jgi:hypothetical protein
MLLDNADVSQGRLSRDVLVGDVHDLKHSSYLFKGGGSGIPQLAAIFDVEGS